MATTYAGSPSKALLGITLGFFFGSAAVSLFGPFHNTFATEMQLTATQVSLLVAIPALSGSLLRIPFGAWVDSTGGKKPFFILMILSCIGMFGMSALLHFAYPGHMQGLYPLVLILGILCGCGIATFSPGMGQTSYWFSKNKQGTASGIFGGVGTLAPGVFALLLSVTMHTLKINSIYFIWAIFLLIGTILYYLLAKNAPFFQFLKKGMSRDQARQSAQKVGEELFPVGGVIKSLTDSAKMSATWYLVVIYFCSFGGFLALTAWLPTFWNKFFSINPVTAGILAAGFSIISALIRIPAGKWSDKIGGLRMCLISMVLLLIASLVMSWSRNIALSLIAILVIAFAFGLCNAATFKLVPRFVSNAVGGASGWVGGLGAFGGFLIPQLISLFIVREGIVGYAHGFWVFAILSVVNILLIYLGMMKTDRQIAQKEKLESNAK